MAILRKTASELINSLSEEKMGKVISFIRFIKEEEDPILLLETDDEEEIEKILEENEWHSSEEIIKIDTRGDIYK